LGTPNYEKVNQQKLRGIPRQQRYLKILKKIKRDTQTAKVSQNSKKIKRETQTAKVSQNSKKKLRGGDRQQRYLEILKN
jgi:hypothetical protein